MAPANNRKKHKKEKKNRRKRQKEEKETHTQRMAMVLGGSSKAEGEQEGRWRPSLCPGRVPQEAPAPQTNTLKLGKECLSNKVWELFKRLLLSWALRQLSLHISPLRAIPQLAMAPWVLQGGSPIALQSQMFGGFIFQVPV